MAANGGNLVELLIGMVGAGGVSAAFGGYLIWQGWTNLCDGRVPLVGQVQLTGIAGRAGAILLIAFGLLAVITGVVLAAFCLWQLPGTIAGE